MVIVTVRVFLVEVPVQECLERMRRAGYRVAVLSVMFQLVRGNTQADQGSESPAQEAGEKDPSAPRQIHGATVAHPQIGVNNLQGRLER